MKKNLAISKEAIEALVRKIATTNSNENPSVSNKVHDRADITLLFKSWHQQQVALHPSIHEAKNLRNELQSPGLRRGLKRCERLKRRLLGLYW
ncbi:hypothetical protein PM082_016513 [Marasmius tenuissimus]|nr:hypothetical protein PM082_016513 [Marasmius tenuissimus]